MRAGVVVLALVFLVGVPAVVTLALTTKGSGTRLKHGPQPGGTLKGTVVASGTAQRLENVRVQLVGVEERGARTALGETRTSSNGGFEIAAPTFHGIYELVAGSGAWRARAEPASFLAWDGHGRSVEPLRFELSPGSELVIELKRRDGRATGGGKWTLSMRQPSAFLMLGVWNEVARGELENGALRAEALPIGPARVVIRLDTGEKVDVELDLVPGTKTKSVDI